MEERHQQFDDLPADSPSNRLETWKEIASYLKRTVRTVRRWEHEEGLPVHRHLHKKLGTVYAYKPEIDAWWARRRLEVDTGPEREQIAFLPGIRRTVGLLTLALLVVVVVVVFAWRRPSHADPAPSARVMLAVLPFENLSGDPEQEYFSDGLTEEMITEVGPLRPERLGVIAHSSVMRYKQKTRSAQQIGRELGVEYLLEGGVRREGDRVRISAQLIRVSDQTHVWAESYDRPLRDILQLQKDVARNIAAAIRIQLTVDQQVTMTSARPVEAKAYESYLKARHFWSKRTREGIERARAYLEHALEIDPHFALAQADLAGVYSMMSYYGVLPPQQVHLQARRAAMRALEMDPNMAEAHAVLGNVKQELEWDWAGAEKAFQRAIELNSNYATAHHWYGLLLERLGRLDEAKVRMQKALQLDPISLIINKNAADPFFYSGEYGRAMEQYQKTLELDPEFFTARLFLGFAFEQKARLADAIAQFERAKAPDNRPAALSALGHAYARAGRITDARRVRTELERSETYIDPYHIALIHAGLGELDDAFRWLNRALERRSVWLLYLKIDPRLKLLRSDRRYENLLRRMNFPPTTTTRTSPG